MSLAHARERIAFHWPRWYVLPVLGLVFFLGLAVGNGHTTSGAVTEAKQESWGDCKWTLRHELTRQRHKLQTQ